MLPNLSIPEMLIFATIALLLFGKRLPEVARSLGKGIVEFKKGLRGVDEEVENATYNRNQTTNSASIPARPAPPDESVEAVAPKFEPPKSEPH